MNKFKSPINDQTYAEIAKFLNKNGTKHFFSVDENIEVFKKSYPDFEHLISDLTQSEQTRAWFYLKSLAKKSSSAQSHEEKIASDQKKAYSSKLIINIMTIALAAVILWLIYSFFTKEPAPLTNEQKLENLTYNSQDAVKLRLKDPDSAKFRDTKGNCGFVNAKNSFGAFNGFTRYVVVADIVTLETDKMPDNLSFDEFWDNMCKNQ